MPNTVLVDGGVGMNLNLVDAVNRCKEVSGEDESKIYVDIITCDNLGYKNNTVGHTKHNYLLWRQLHSFYHRG